MLIFRLQPDEGMLVKFNLKEPTQKAKIINKNLEFHYKNLGENIIDDAYETLILDVFNGDTMLFSRSDFVEKAWEIVDPLINNKSKLYVTRQALGDQLNVMIYLEIQTGGDTRVKIL